jgi:hypothetical protein
MLIRPFSEVRGVFGAGIHTDTVQEVIDQPVTRNAKSVCDEVEILSSSAWRAAQPRANALCAG